MSAYTQTIARAIRKGSDVLTGDDAAVLERDLTEYQDTADTLRTDNERLREALSLLLRTAHDTVRHPRSDGQILCLEDATDIARAALVGKGGAE